MLPKPIDYDCLESKILQKFDINGRIQLRFRDSQGDYCVVEDDEDLSTAQIEAGMNAGHTVDRLELWCEEW